MGQRNNRVIVLAAIAFLSAIVVLGGGTYLLLRRSVVRITRLARSVTHLAASRDFSEPIDVPRGNDEISALGAAVVALVGLLRSVLASLRDSSGRLAEAGQVLTDGADEQAKLLERHVRFIDEAVTSSEEIKRTSESVARRTAAVLAAAELAGKLGLTGDVAVQGTLGALEDIKRRVTAMGEHVGLLAQQAQEISGIARSVKSLADSSNMLALNAAIEAVRSGERGRGFALVAREMRSLADQSIRATERVREILNDVTAAIRQISAISARGSRRIAVGLDQLVQSGTGLRQLAQVAGESSRSAQAIATVVKEQNDCVLRLARAMAEQDQVARRTSEGLGRTRESARVLREVTSQVTDLLRGYRL